MKRTKRIFLSPPHMGKSNLGIEEFRNLQLKTAKKRRIFLSPPHLGEYEQQFVAEAFESN